MKRKHSYYAHAVIFGALLLLTAALAKDGASKESPADSSAKVIAAEVARQKKDRQKSIKQLRELVEKQRTKKGWLGDGSLPPNVRAVKDIAYGAKSQSQKLDLFIPKSSALKTKAGLPLVIWIHGGGWSGGDKAGGPINPLLEAGFAAASINYRLSGEAKWPAQLDDCRSALTYIRAHAKDYGIDTKRMGVWGGSAGGHLVLMLALKGETPDMDTRTVSKAVALKPLDVAAVCDWFGPTDLARYIREPKQIQFAVEMIRALIGTQGSAFMTGCEDASPLHYVGQLKQVPPLLIMHGRNDQLVPISQSQLLYERMKSQGLNNVRLVSVDGGHGYPGFELDAMLDVVKFFKVHLHKEERAVRSSKS
ncbi:MAG: alpha/beta hydrolase [Candidatus Melainabacteria bacterium]|nr:alpha/beta hydrolase [Candidatus Melainabacteria bacterium]